jgi:hypothetical protein
MLSLLKSYVTDSISLIRIYSDVFFLCKHQADCVFQETGVFHLGDQICGHTDAHRIPLYPFQHSWNLY